jgi:flagella basal body P-ring formation protein FlgA
MMKFVSVAFLILFSLTSLAARFDVRVQEMSTVRSGEPIKLGQIVTESSQKALSEHFYNIVVYEALAADEERSITAEGLTKTLRQKLSFQDLQDLSLKTPAKISFRAKRNFLSAKDLTRDLLTKAQEACGTCEAEMDEMNIPEIKGSGEILQVKLDTQNFRAGGSFLLPLHVVTSQGNSSYWLTGKTSLYKMAPIATRMIMANERIAEADIQMKRINVNFARDGFSDIKNIIGKKAARTLSLNQPIFTADLKKEPAVQRGQIVKIVLGDDAFEVAISGTAEESGAVGDMIKVKSNENQKMLSGTLIEPGIVKVN